MLIHGFTTNRHENWRRLGWYGAFERKRMPFVALDCRGHGESAKPHDPAAYTREAMVGDIVALMDHLGVGACRSPRLLDGRAHGARGRSRVSPKRFPMAVLGGIGAKLFEPRPPGNPMAEAMEADDPETITNPLLRSFRRFADEQGEDRLALAALTRAADPPFTRDDVAALSVPTLVVAGAATISPAIRRSSRR